MGSRNRRKQIFCLLCVFANLLLPFVGFAQVEIEQEDKDHAKFFFNEALTTRQSYQWLEELCQIGPRLSGSENSLIAIHWVKEVMDTCAFDQVFLQDVQVPHWERGEPEIAVLKDSKGNIYPLNVLAIGGSIPTPRRGLQAKILEVSSLNEIDEYAIEEVEGKVIFYNPPFDQRNIMTGASYGANVGTRSRGAIKGAEKGAVASLIRSVSSAYDDVPHTGTGSYHEDMDSIPAAALGVQSAEIVHKILQLDEEAQIHLQINSHWHPETSSYNVVAEIKGSLFPKEIIVVGGHLDSWDVGDGAHDDGAGCMHALGALYLIKKSGWRPKRTLRAVMFINEENGTRGGKKYAELAIQNNENHIVAIESDAGGFSPRGFGVMGSEESRQKMNSWLPLFPKNTISYFSKGGGGVDIEPLHRADGTPMIGLSTDSQRMFDLHHSANDTFDRVHPRELELGTASLATLIYMIDKYGL